MQLTVVATLCHLAAGLSAPVCHEEVVVKDDLPAAVCQVLQAAVDEWKESAVYSGYEWSIAAVKCQPGYYLPKDVV